jgi:hypothetical protein
MKRMRKITDWLKEEGIPGFRSGSRLKMAIATIGHLLFLSVIVTAIFASYILPIPVDQTTNPTPMPGLPAKEPIPTPSPIPVSTSSPTPAQEATPKLSPTPAPTPTLLSSGGNKWYTVDDFEVCVRDVQRLNSIELENDQQTVYPKDEDYQFLAVHIIIRNVGDVVLLNTPSEDNAYILDPRNKAQYESTRKGSCYKRLGPAYHGNTKLFPGVEEEGVILFEIPEDAKRDLRFVLKISSGNYIQWAI